MKQLITEIFNIKNGRYRKNDGTEIPIVYIDPETSENTYQYRDKIRNEFGAVWMKNIKTWAWFASDPSVYDKKVKPCLEFLISVEKNENNEKRDVIAIIDKLLAELNGGNIESTDSLASDKFDIEGVKTKLESFKRELVSIMSDEEFKEKLMPIIKFRNAQGHEFSLINAILAYIQDPKATMVKSRGNWLENFNRTVVDDAPAIVQFVPYGGIALSEEEKEQRKTEFLNRVGKSTTKELTPGEKDKLRVLLKPKGYKGFKLLPNFYDVRFTKQVDGKEDVVGHAHNGELPWFDDSGEVTETTEMYCDAVIEIAQERGIKVGYVDDMGGARGVSKSGAIDVLKDAPKNAGLFNTLTHEYAHELLHQRYIKAHDANPHGYGQFFIGTSEGRAAVEQQAELCAWIVLRNFGFDMPTNINYVGLWGMDEEKAPRVFDTVARAATQIIKDISVKTSTMQESVTRVIFEMTGLDVAKLIGCEDIYLRNDEDSENFDDEKRTAFTESFNKIFNNLTTTRNCNLRQPFRL